MLAFGLAALDFARFGRWSWAGGLAGLAAIVEPVGGFALIAVLLIVALRSDEAWRRYLRFVIVPAALAALLMLVVTRSHQSDWFFGLLISLPFCIVALPNWQKARHDPFAIAILAWGLVAIAIQALTLRLLWLMLIPGLSLLASYNQQRLRAALLIPLHLIMLVGVLVVPHAAYLAGTRTRTELRLDITDMRIVPANLDYGRDLKLVGVALDQVAIPGREIRVRLDWWLARFPTADLKLNIALVNRENVPIVSAEDIVPAGRWQQAHVVTEHTVSVPEQPPGALKVFVTANYQAARLGAQTVGRVIVPVGPRPTDAPTIAHLGDTGSLLLAPTITARGESLHVILRWRAAGPLDRDYKFFLHVQDSPEKILAQVDSEPQGGNYPTSLWQAGDVVIDESITLNLSGLPVGRHMLQFGMYGENTRLTLRPCQGQPADSIQLATIVIAADRTISLEAQTTSC
jgi:hypothetical protein